MKDFIELTLDDGKRVLVHTKYIEEVREDDSKSCTIYLAFTCPDSCEQDYYRVNKPYDEVVSELLKGGVE